MGTMMENMFGLGTDLLEESEINVEDEFIEKITEGDLPLEESSLSINDLKAFYATSDSIDKDKYPNFFEWYDYMVRSGKYHNESVEKTDEDEDGKEEKKDKILNEEDPKESLGYDINEYQEWVDYDMKHYGKISDETNQKLNDAGLEVVKDDHGDYEVIAKDRKELGEAFKEKFIFNCSDEDNKEYCQHNGQECTIKTDEGNGNYIVEFEDGTILDALDDELTPKYTDPKDDPDYDPEIEESLKEDVKGFDTTTDWVNYLTKKLNLDAEESHNLLHDLNNLRGYEWISELEGENIPVEIIDAFKKFVNADSDGEALECAQMSFESGHRFEKNDFEDSEAYNEYLKYMEMGPAGFYEEFKDELDFDKDFIAEYGEIDESLNESLNEDRHNKTFSTIEDLCKFLNCDCFEDSGRLYKDSHGEVLTLLDSLGFTKDDYYLTTDTDIDNGIGNPDAPIQIIYMSDRGYFEVNLYNNLLSLKESLNEDLDNNSYYVEIHSNRRGVKDITKEFNAFDSAFNFAKKRANSKTTIYIYDIPKDKRPSGYIPNVAYSFDTGWEMINPPKENLLKEDTVKKSNGKWVNRGDDGKEHGEFSTKKQADAQRKAMFANGFKGESKKVTESYEWDNEWKEAFPGSSTKIKGYADSSKDLDSQVVGSIYPPSDEFLTYTAEIWDNNIADQVEEKEGFETEEDAKKWVEDWFKKNESKKVVKEDIDDSDSHDDLIEKGYSLIYTGLGRDKYIIAKRLFDKGIEISSEEAKRLIKDHDLRYDTDYSSFGISWYVKPENKSLTEDVEETLPGPTDENNMTLSSMISQGIKDEYDTIELYNSIAYSARELGRDDIAELIDNINTEENNHVGMLQSAFKTLSKNGDAVDSGDKEAEEYLGESVKLELKESNDFKLELR